MAILNLNLKDITTLTDLSKNLNVDVNALRLVKLLPDVPCKRSGCILPAVENNNKHCILCSQTWYPKLLNNKGEKTKNCRGYGLYGLQYTRNYGGTKNSPAVCCCTTPLCEKIGYSHEGMFYLPTKKDDLHQAMIALGIRDSGIRKKIEDNPLHFKVAPWHYRLAHREKIDGKWHLKRMETYTDDEGKQFSFPPPNARIQDYIDNEIPRDHEYCRGGFDNDLPQWAVKLARLQYNSLLQPTPTTSSAVNVVRPTPVTSSSVATRLDAVFSSTPRPRSKRTSPDTIQIKSQDDEIRYLQSELQKSLQQITGLNATVTSLRDEVIEVRLQRDEAVKKVDILTDEIKALHDRLDKLKSHQLPLTAEHFKPGGALEKFVADYTFFPDWDCNEAFLHLVNFTEGCPPGDGLCENMRRYHHVSMAERLKYNNMTSNDIPVANEDTAANEDDYQSDSDADEEQTGGRKRKIDWMTEWLVYCFHVKCGLDANKIAPLFGISKTLVHDILYGWANVLVLALTEFFPMPTRSQMLRAYPKSHIRKLGHAKTFMLLDATEIFAEIASLKSVNSILYSHYKSRSTLKFLVGCDPIGVTWAESISKGYPGSVSDPVATAISEIVNTVPYGSAVEVDKGFLIENSCAEVGVVLIRPSKLLRGQVQQSEVETANTQKVGNTRIVIEQVNNQGKQMAGCFDKKVRMDQLGLADLLVYSTFLMTNFRLALIQGNSTSNVTDKGRPCKAKIRWHDGFDDGLVDVRGQVELWGTQTEIYRWHALRNNTANSSLSDIDISELVLKEDWPSKLREVHIEKLNSN